MEPQTGISNSPEPNQAKPPKVGMSPSLRYTLIGALVAGLAFIPLTIISAVILNKIFDILDIATYGDMEDFLLMWVCLLPAVWVGALGGLAGSALTRKKFHRVAAWVGAVAGGLIAAMLIAFLMNGQIYRGWIATGKDIRARETSLQSASMKPIPLQGDFQLLTTLPSYSYIWTVSPDRKWLAVGEYQNHLITIWDIERIIVVGRIPDVDMERDTLLEFSSDGRWLVSSLHNNEKELIVWSVHDEKQVFVLEGHQGGLCHLAVSSVNNLAASGDKQGNIILWDLSNGKEDARIENQGKYCSDMAFSPDGKMLAYGDYNEEKAVYLWDVAQHKLVGSLELPQGINANVGLLSFNSDGSLLVGKVNEAVVFWDMKAQTPLGAIPIFDSDSISKVDFNPDDNSLAITHLDGVYIFDPFTQAPIGKLNSDGNLSNAIFLPGGKVLAIDRYPGGTTKIGIWTIETP